MMNNYDSIDKYYRFHSMIYDYTRYLFLFGRRNLLDKLNKLNANSILDVGAGTGYFANNISVRGSRIVALDLSQAMLNKLKSKSKTSSIEVINSNFLDHTVKYDVLIFSYSLTIMLETHQRIINHAKELLNPNGIIAVVDFHCTTNKSYDNYMKMHNIILSSELNKSLCDEFEILANEIESAYFGVWKYFVFLGRNAK